MERHRAVLRLGAGVIGLAVFLRLLSGGFFQPLTQLPQQEGVLSFLVYLQTGRVVRLPQTQPEQTQPESTQPEQTQPTVSEPAVQEPVRSGTVVTAEDLGTVSVKYGCDYRPEVENLLLSPLSWELSDGQPAVLIVHTHATESYTQAEGESYEESGAYRTLDDHYNMVSIGDEIASVLEAGGISVIHDRTYHDYPSYNGAYVSARESIQAYLEQYPSIRMVLDIHRDASGDSAQGQMTTAAAVGGEKSAQLMLVVGTDAGGNQHPGWQQNLALALKLTGVLERENPGLCRDINLRSERFNMDMTPGSLLIEVGAAGNTHREALTAARALAEGILEIANGVNR